MKHGARRVKDDVVAYLGLVLVLAFPFVDVDVEVEGVADGLCERVGGVVVPPLIDVFECVVVLEVVAPVPREKDAFSTPSFALAEA